MSTPQTTRLFCWTVCAYRKPGMSEEAYHTYMSTIHAPLVRDLMAQYGIVSWEMVPNFQLTSLQSPHIKIETISIAERADEENDRHTTRPRQRR